MLWLLLLQVLASCLWLGHSEVVTSFKNSCPQFFYQNIPPNNALEPQKPAWICQRYKNQYHFATLYDRKLRIPVYSAYIYQPGSGKRPCSFWSVEPQLINQGSSKEMKNQETLIKQRTFTLEQIQASQAVNEDYKNLAVLNRGHLSTSSHQRTDEDRCATFTLTNIVPQDIKLNGDAWNKYEKETMAEKTKDCTAASTYVITGAVPGDRYIASGRVNIPSHIWSAACCKKGTKMKAWAVIAENSSKNEVQLLTLGELEAKLTQLYGRGRVSLFDSACPRK